MNIDDQCMNNWPHVVESFKWRYLCSGSSDLLSV